MYKEEVKSKRQNVHAKVIVLSNVIQVIPLQLLTKP